MIDHKPVYTDAVLDLMNRTDEVVPAEALAPILKMHPDVIRKYAKDGTWDSDRLGNYVISGGRVKFFRKDFLQKCGFLEPEAESEEPTDHQLMAVIVETLERIQKTQERCISVLKVILYITESSEMIERI